MKSILLTSTALVAFAGAAAADGHASISNAFSATIGYNTEIDGVGEDGFFWEGNLKTTATAALDNGLTAGAYFEVTVAQEDGIENNDGGLDFVGSDFVISLESDTASLFFGDTGTAADKHWTAAGNMEQDGFTPDGDGSTAVLRGDVTFGSVDASVSYLIDDDSKEAEQLSIGAGASFGAVSLALAYQEDTDFGAAGDDFVADEIFGVAASGTFAGATVTVAYAERDLAAGAESSTGVKIAYPFGPVTVNASYVDESNGDANWELGATYASGPISVTAEYEENGNIDGTDTDDWTIEGSYDAGNGLTILAGILNENEGDDADYYVAADYDLGGGATASFAFAEDDDGDQGDEIGAGEYDPGVTIKVSFEF